VGGGPGVCERGGERDPTAGLQCDRCGDHLLLHGGSHVLGDDALDGAQCGCGGEDLGVGRVVGVGLDRDDAGIGRADRPQRRFVRLVCGDKFAE
jgi:hypothetical protein